MSANCITPPECHQPGRRAWLAGIAGLVTHSRAAGALEPPQGKVVLSISGKVTRTNAVGRADFDMAMLAALPQHHHTMSTPWYKAAHRFSGPLLRDVLAAAGARGTLLVAEALNRYKVEIPVEDSQWFRVIVATQLDGKPMGIRDKGPLFIIYPFHESADLRSERYYSRSAWQLRWLNVR